MTHDPVTLTVQPYAPHHRPLLHFAPAKNWINDPNGLIFLNGEYHLFFQHNPHGTDWGHMSWGHAVSKDLLHWEELPVALEEDDQAMIFSGCCVLDAENTSGLGTPLHPPLIALYTGHHRNEIQSQQLAYSLDQGRTWTKYGIVLTENIPDFRDPKVFWHPETQQWVMALVLASEHQVVLYGSADLLSWHKLSTFGPAGHTGGIWEVPELLRLSDDSGQEHWVLKVDLNPGGPHGGSGCQYFVGHFDGQAFAATQEAKWLDHGKDFYAAITFANTADRTVWLAWMNNWQYARDHIHSTYSGHMSLPREIHLEQTESGLVLVQRPVRELDGVWSQLQTLQQVQLNALDQVELLHLPAAALDAQLSFSATPHSVYGLSLHCDGQLEWTLEFQPDQETTVLTRRGQVWQEGFQGKHAAPLAAKGLLDVRLILDHSALEVFVDSGKQVFTEAFFPAEGLVSLFLYVKSGSVKCQIEGARGPAVKPET
ncbi:glycoside hydrolase family 32 protein [Deinococcus roseus]|uniref:Levanase n=1 Tax=Deinococcus roseus TaxID=392414 RepID=A0ABQ2D267_9DEIO|nr:glycoside hydrolase family 32 protein [Deinococcus roseus]GGJ42827.1 hypothetical protein GCM10008938_31290 [Deinococcus roseus]